MILQPARVEQAFFTKQAPKLIRHIKPVLPLEADGLVADVYDQMAREFQLTPPVILHSPIPDLLASVWGAQREAMVAGPTSRALRETVPVMGNSP